MFTGLFIDSFQISPYIDQSSTDLTWNIAAGPGSNFSPNVLSEISFDGVKIRGGGVAIAYLNKLNDRIAFYVEGDLSRSSGGTGKARDSDYLGDNRTEEFSRTYAEAKGHGSYRDEAALGFKYRWLSTRGHYFSVLIGMSEVGFDVNMTDGVQFIPEENGGLQILGLDSSYDAKFKAQFVGVMSEHAFSFGTFGLRIERHQVEFDAKANWNLRSDLAHDVSFAQTGEGDGYIATVGYSYALNESWDCYLNVTKQNLAISDGYDHTFMSDGSGFVSRLNEVRFDVLNTQIGTRYIF